MYTNLRNNKWQCQNCRTVQSWEPSEEYWATEVEAARLKAKKPGQQGSIFNSFGLVGVGADGCLSNVQDDGTSLHAIFGIAAFVAIAVTTVVYYFEEKKRKTEYRS